MNLKTVQSHVSKDETRYHLNGVFFDKGSAIATDGHRLIKCNVGLDADLHSLNEQHKGHIFNVKSGLRVDGKYPNYEALIPKEQVNRQFTLDFPIWLKDIKQRKSNVSPIFISSLGFQSYKPTDETLVWAAFNPHYLAPYAGQTMTVQLQDKMSPMMLKSKDCDWLAVVMPMRA
jgi:DNA polymerase III sliding clamp (beta) subunit (PCNA family)